MNVRLRGTPSLRYQGPPLPKKKNYFSRNFRKYYMEKVMYLPSSETFKFIIFFHWIFSEQVMKRQVYENQQTFCMKVFFKENLLIKCLKYLKRAWKYWFVYQSCFLRMNLKFCSNTERSRFELINFFILKYSARTNIFKRTCSKLYVIRIESFRIHPIFFQNKTIVQIKIFEDGKKLKKKKRYYVLKTDFFTYWLGNGFIL
jgi:hypothetical protein